MAELSTEGTDSTAPASAEPEREVETTRGRRLLQLAGIYAASRLVTLAFLYIAAALALPKPLSRFGAGMNLDRFVVGWDGQWYWTIAYFGYPSTLGTTPSGATEENAWAFMPLYAWLSNIVGMPFGYWGIGAAIVSLVSGFVACVALYRLLHRRIGIVAALWAVIFFANGPLAALFHVGYAEAMFIALLLISLNLVVERRFAWLLLLIPLMGYTRPGVLAFSLMLALYGIWRWLHRKTDPLPTNQIVWIIVTGLWAAVIGLSWQVIAGIVTGQPDAYLATELAWRRNWIPDSNLAFFPFEGWIAGLNFWFAQWHLSPMIGWALFIGALASVVWALVFSRSVRVLGMEVRLWSASYLLYLVAVFFPQSSTLRLLMPLTPLAGALAVPKSNVWRSIVLLGCLIYQGFWIYSVYSSGITITQIP